MRGMRRFKPSPALVVASIALLVALGGTSWAAVTLAPRSVDNAALKTSAVNSRVIQNGQVKSSDLAPGVIRRGPPGAPGADGAAGAAGQTGPSGPAGPGAKWALISKDGVILAQSGGITVAHPFAGAYYANFGSAVTGKTVQVTNAYRDDDSSFRGAPLASICGAGTEGSTCVIAGTNNTSTVFVGTETLAGANENHAFYIAVF